MIRVTKGHQIKITCEAFGEKPLHLKWLKDGLDLDSLTEKKYVRVKLAGAKGTKFYPSFHWPFSSLAETTVN